MATNLDKARCEHCGWLVPDDGITIPRHLDIPHDVYHQKDRCWRTSGASCVSERVVTVDGDQLRYVPLRSGPTQPEDERRRGQVLLRLSPAELRALDAVARAWGVSRSDAVARLSQEQRERDR